ncbi:MAG: hypothetical protein COB30_014135 [Ectothiorhodospiraceae bacterium]|nr:hypothetical protein [Ectothiorhodospiraceae bacterium]
MLLRDTGKGMAVKGDVQDSRQAGKVSSPLFLAIDQGGHASRVLVFDQSGHKVVEVFQAVDVSRPQTAWVEQDADALLQSIRTALDDVESQLGTRKQYVVAAGLVTQRSNIVCWDRHTGQALSPAISWQDCRAYQWMQGFEANAATIRRITGLIPSAHYGVSKMHWCLENLPKVSAAHANGNLACAPLASYLLFKLLEEQPFVVDAVNASRTLLWDKAAGGWSEELLTLFSLKTDCLPKGVSNRHEYGTLVLGNHKIPLTVCSGDQSAALFSLGMPNTGTAYLNMGTGAFMQSLFEPPQNGEKLPARLLQSTVWDEKGKSIQVLEATVNGAGSALAVLEQVFEEAVDTTIQRSNIQKSNTQQSNLQKSINYEEALQSAKNIPLYLNGISGLGSPFWLPDFRSRFMGGAALTALPDEKRVAVMESILFLLQVNLEAFRCEKVDLKNIVISGGLSQLDGLCQRLADLSRLPVIRPQLHEATAKGLAFLLVSSCSETSPLECLPSNLKDLENESQIQKKWSGNETMDRFIPVNNPVVDERYKQWRAALDEALGYDIGNATNNTTESDIAEKGSGL